MPTIPLPLPINPALFSAPQGQPTYTDIFNDTMGNLGTPDDGYDAALADAVSLADGLDAELRAADSLGSIDQALSAADSFDSSELDTHIANYEATIPTGQGFISSLETQNPPLLLELPMSISFDGGIGAAPTQETIDFGTLKLNSAPVTNEVGFSNDEPDGTYVGVLDVQVILRTGGQWDILEPSTTTHQGFVKTQYFVQFTPNQVGEFTAQVNAIWAFPAQQKILTYKVSVIP